MSAFQRRAGLSVALLGLLAWPCACSSSSAVGPAPHQNALDAGLTEGGDLEDSGSTSVDAAGSPNQDASSGGDAAGDAAREDGASDAMSSTAADADAGDDGAGFTGPAPPGAACSRTASWGAGVLLSVSSVSDPDAFDAITPDELSVVWTLGQGSARTVNYADRGSTSDPFGAPQSLAAGQFITDRVAISPDGLRLIVVNADAQGFSELTRTTRTGAFGVAATGSFSNLDAAGVLSAGQSYGDPVLSADDTVFFYSVYGASGQTQTIFRSARLLPGEAWSDGAPVQASAFNAQGALRRRPSGISADKQTLFFWDDVSSMERAAWINDSTGVFDTFVDLGARSMAAPNQACSRLYYSAQGASSVDVFTSTSQ